MKLAVGPLTTGTYVSHAVAHPGKYYGLHQGADGTNLKFGMVADKEHEGIKWDIVKVGENKFKTRNNSFGAKLAVNPVDKQVVEATNGGIEWIIEPTDVVGEYIARPAQSVSTPSEAISKMQTRFKIYRVDDDTK